MDASRDGSSTGGGGGTVVVVGAGAVGLSAAWYLRRAGRSVTIVARDPVGEGASAGNAGMIVPSHVVPLASPGVIAKGLRWLLDPASPFYIRLRLDRDLLAWLWRFRAACREEHVVRSVPVLRDLSLASVDLLREMEAEIGDLGFAPTGLLMLYRSDKGRAENLELADVAAAAGLDVEPLDAAGTRRIEPALRGEVTGSVLYRQDGRLDPDRYLGALRAAVEAAGVTVREGVTVTGLRREGGRVRAVITDRGDVAAEEVVVAAGSWSPALLDAPLPVQPAKGYSLTFPAPAEGPRIPMILTEEKVTVTPLGSRLRFAGTLALSGLDPSIDRRRVEPIARTARAYGVLGAEDAPEVWSGFRPCSPDGLPILGRVPGRPGLTVATGHGMMGLTLAPVTGRLVADLLEGVPPLLDLAPLSPARFL